MWYLFFLIFFDLSWFMCCLVLILSSVSVSRSFCSFIALFQTLSYCFIFLFWFWVKFVSPPYFPSISELFFPYSLFVLLLFIFRVVHCYFSLSFELICFVLLSFFELIKYFVFESLPWVNVFIILFSGFTLFESFIF